MRSIDGDDEEKCWRRMIMKEENLFLQMLQQD